MNKEIFDEYTSKYSLFLDHVIDNPLLTETEKAELIYHLGGVSLKLVAYVVSGVKHNNHTALLVPDNKVELVRKFLSENGTQSLAEIRVNGKE